MSNNIVKIGTALKWRSDFDINKKFYLDNLTTSYGSVFRCKVVQTQHVPPVRVTDEAGHIELSNTHIWDVVVNNLDIYNMYIDSLAYLDETRRVANSLTELENRLQRKAQKIEAITYVNINVLVNNAGTFPSLRVALNTLSYDYVLPGLTVSFIGPDGGWQTWQWQGKVWEDDNQWVRQDDNLKAVQILDEADLANLEAQGLLDPDKLYYTAE